MNKTLYISILLLVAVFASGCDGLAALYNIGKPSDPDARGVQRTSQHESPPVPVQLKGYHGIDVGVNHFTNNGTYNPDQMAVTISSTGSKGMTRQTFAEAGSDLQVDLDSTGKRMIFATTRYSKTPQICVQGTTSKAVTLITQDNMSDMMPKFSPDGKLVAWATDRHGNWDILIKQADAAPTAQGMQLTRSTDDDIHPSWSPDAGMDSNGKLKGIIAFSRFNAMDGVWQIWILDTKTRSISYLTEGLFPEFNPKVEKTAKGKTLYTIAFQQHRKRSVPFYSVWTIKIQMGKTGAIEAVKAPTEIVANDKWAAITPTWSPNGDYIAFASVRKGRLSQWQARIYKPDDIWVVRSDGTDLTQITSHAAPDWNPCWAKEEGNPMGRIYFSSERTGHANIWSVKPVIAGLVTSAMSIE